jgi:hypothetical protein
VPGKLAATGAKIEQPARLLHGLFVTEDLEKDHSVGEKGLSQQRSVGFKPHRLTLKYAYLPTAREVVATVRASRQGARQASATLVGCRALRLRGLPIEVVEPAAAGDPICRELQWHHEAGSRDRRRGFLGPAGQSGFQNAPRSLNHAMLKLHGGLYAP